MCQVKVYTAIAIAAMLTLFVETDAMPSRILSRQKRISDQRLAELETLIALSKMKTKMVTIPVGFGKVDPLKIGRRKRSMETLLKKLRADVTSDEDLQVESNDSEENVVEVETNLLKLTYDDGHTPYRELPVRLPE